MFEWNEGKSDDTKAERGFGFEIVDDFDFDAAVTVEDDRHDYGERRFRSFGFIKGELFSIAWTPRGKNVRIISVRRAHTKEGKRYGLL